MAAPLTGQSPNSCHTGYSPKAAGPANAGARHWIHTRGHTWRQRLGHGRGGIALGYGGAHTPGLTGTTRARRARAQLVGLSMRPARPLAATCLSLSGKSWEGSRRGFCGTWRESRVLGGRSRQPGGKRCAEREALGGSRVFPIPHLTQAALCVNPELVCNHWQRRAQAPAC